MGQNSLRQTPRLPRCKWRTTRYRALCERPMRYNASRTSATDGLSHPSGSDTERVCEDAMQHNSDRNDHQPTERAPKQPKQRRRAESGQRASGRTQSRIHDWPLRSAIQRQRLGAWFYWTRKTRLHYSLRTLCDEAARDGVSMGVGVIQRIEVMARDEAAAARREHVSLEVVLWLAAHSGQALVDVARWIEGGDWRQVGDVTDQAPSAEALADRVRALMLTLPPQYQDAIAQFAEHERQAADLAFGQQFSRARPSIDPAVGSDIRSAISPTPLAHQAANQATSQPTDADTQAVFDDIARAQQLTHDALRQIAETAGEDSDDEGQNQRPHDQQPRGKRRITGQ